MFPLMKPHTVTHPNVTFDLSVVFDRYSRLRCWELRFRSERGVHKAIAEMDPRVSLEWESSRFHKKQWRRL